MTVLVTGGAGFIGSQVAAALVARGTPVRILDALTQPVHPAGVSPRIPDGAEFLAGDVRDRDAWTRALEGVDAVVHLAAYQDYGLDSSRFFDVNVTGTALLFELIVERALPIRRVVVASSQSVYGEGLIDCPEHGPVAAAQRRTEDLARGELDARCGTCGRPGPPLPMREDFASPHNAYGISKQAAETAALVLGAQHGIETAALRYAIVHGPGQSPHNAYSGLLRAAAMALLAGRPPVVFEDGRQLREYVAIDDAVSATLVALDHPDAPGRAYNVNGPRAWTVLEVVEALGAIAGDGRAPELPGTFRLGDVRHTLGDTSALRALGWTPSTDLHETWSRYWAWLREQSISSETVAAALEDMRNKGILRASDI